MKCTRWLLLPAAMALSLALTLILGAAMTSARMGRVCIWMASFDMM